MADVFISYKREERQAVERLAQELRRLGLDVWFDASLNAGEAFSDEIDREARGAKAILICWSPAARASDWVKAEALIGFTNKKLAACYAAGPDGFDPPAPFNSIHAEDLRTWLAAPSPTHAGWKSVLRRIGKLCGREDIESYGALDVQAPASELRSWIAAHEASPLFMEVDELLRVRDAEEIERTRIEQEARERRGREEQKRRERAIQEEEQRARDADAAAVRSARRAPWGLIIGGGIVAALVAGVLLNAGQQRAAPPAEETVVQAQASEPEPRSQAVQPRADQAVSLPEMVPIPGRNFEVGRYETTFAQWDACVAGGGCNGYTPNDQGWGRGNRPVINVSWNDAQAYVQWLSQLTGQRYRLMTSAEWEIAADAGSTSTYSWGNEPAVCNENARNGANFADCTDDRTRPVGSFQPNGVGLYDMHGNVWEWVEDCDDSSCAARVLRGGSWLNQSPDLRIANRSSYYPNNREDFGSLAGFRVARTI